MAEDAWKLRDWILENAGLEAQSMPVAIRILRLMDRERWEAYEREHTLSTWEEGVELVLSYLEAAITTTAAQVAGPPAEECLLSPSPPAEGECLLVLPPQPKWEEPEHPQPKWEEPEHPQPMREEPECTQPEREEPERPTPEWEEPERPTPEWEEPERPTPEWGEPDRPQPKREESVHPQPKEGGVGASIAQEGEGGACTALGPKRGFHSPRTQAASRGRMPAGSTSTSRG
ncbi:UNVERIFIED_CONTAM: hypothetical protein FKN15_052948 [Acipenser sinensis]